MIKYFFLITSCIALLTACSGYRAPTAVELHGQRGALKPGGNYIIKRGDTLFGIAWRYGLDMDELARWNNITDKNHILAGTVLRTSPPIGIERETVIAPSVSQSGLNGWIWPTRGNVTQSFSPTQPGKQGIRINGVRGQNIRAASDGEVAYTGTGLSGFGRMVIIRHKDRILSAYGYLDKVHVSEGQKIQRGQPLGTMGIGPRNTPMLHFETRKQGKPVNPYAYIGTTPRY
ncbi:peptidoglycan DD-metalloendopeptidase family protein [Suttonella ornithocola]|uniref:Murein hydrolase activator NlpD n=1 Tax=Suttonella ornithocola TaxID=279832 RepID=A0A380RAM9_9GAMM|nr:peptidoglycan DD-metalloendopeptidase family protein [Suttonella ornithocola]SUO95427.1 Murein hydrolase activator NlpD precursor [Suttonella ornithocola]SUQ09737.1 Murein hydrolase activator NlpD precursor [Suttonella ornithocola]